MAVMPSIFLDQIHQYSAHGWAGGVRLAGSTLPPAPRGKPGLLRAYAARSSALPAVRQIERFSSPCKRLGRPKGRLSAVTKLSGKDDLIREYLAKKIPVSVIARLLNVHRSTVRNYIQTRKLQPSSS
jgi:hypothetical protein